MDSLWNMSLVVVGQVSFSDSLLCETDQKLTTKQESTVGCAECGQRIQRSLIRPSSYSQMNLILNVCVLYQNFTVWVCFWFCYKLYWTTYSLNIFQLNLFDNLSEKYLFDPHPFLLDHCWPYSDEIVYYYFIFLLVPVLEKLNVHLFSSSARQPLRSRL